MNYNTKNIIQTYAIITGNEDKDDIQKKLMKSKVFREVKNGNQTYLYEGYTANILEIVDELKKMDDCPSEILKITPDAVVITNRARKYSRRRTGKVSGIKAKVPSRGLKAFFPHRTRV